MGNNNRRTRMFSRSWYLKAQTLPHLEIERNKPLRQCHIRWFHQGMGRPIPIQQLTEEIYSEKLGEKQEWLKSRWNYTAVVIVLTVRSDCTGFPMIDTIEQCATRVGKSYWQECKNTPARVRTIWMDIIFEISHIDYMKGKIFPSMFNRRRFISCDIFGGFVSLSGHYKEGGNRT